MTLKEIGMTEGKHPFRQLIILITLILQVITIWHLSKLLFVYGLSYAFGEGLTGWLVRSNLDLPVIFLITTGISLPMFLHSVINPAANMVHVTINTLVPKFTQRMATDFIVYRTGFGFKFWWESKGFPTEIDREIPLDTGEEFVMMGEDHVTLMSQIGFTVRPLYSKEGLNKWFQNGDSEDERKKIFTIVKDAVIQAAKTTSRKRKTHSLIIKNLDTIADRIKDSVQETACRYGLEIENVKFRKCAQTQKSREEFDEVAEVEAYKGIITQLQGVDENGKPEMSREKAAKLAAVLANKPGATMFDLEIGADENSGRIAELAAKHPELARELISGAGKKKPKK